MSTEQSHQIQRELSKNHRHRIWVRVVSALMACAVFCTTYLLILPAITLTKETVCGLEEHTHSDSCYETRLICDQDETEEHTHTEDCYEKVLTCTLPEHTHDDSCYASDSDNTDVSETTDTEEDTGLCEHHPEHTAECGYTEGTPCNHEHTDECYTFVTNCVHEHTADCYPSESIDEETGEPLEGAKPTLCTHVCTQETGCIKKELNCQHVHDEDCGYSEGTPCNYECEICDNLLSTEEIQQMIDELPAVDELETMSTSEVLEWYEKLQDIADAIDLLSEEEQEKLTGTDRLMELADWFNSRLSAAKEVTVGYLTLTGDDLVENVDYSYDSADGGVVTILSNKTITIKNASGYENTSVTTRIVIPANVTANLVLAGVDISSSVNSAITLTPKAGEYVYYGDSSDVNNKYYINGGATCNIILADGTLNTLTSTHGWYAALRAGESTTLTIDDATANGDSEKPGTLTTTGRNFGAGIGGAVYESGGNITINGGTITSSVTATNWDYGYAAGIGGGGIGDGGNITINGGTITATGTYHGAGIGGGCYNPTFLARNNVINYNEDLSPAVVNKMTLTGIGPYHNGQRGYSGNITINGGYIKSTVGRDSNGVSHGCAFGDGCIGGTLYAKNRGFVVQVNGGTVLAYSNDKQFTYTTVGYYYSDDLGCLGGTVIVTGGSMLADSFVTNGDVSKAYDDYGNEVFMTYISMKYLGLGERGLKVTGIKVAVNGKEIVYADGDTFGLPSYTDPDQMFYLWIPKTAEGEEVSVELNLVDSSGNSVETTPFYITDVCHKAYLKQYVDFSDDLKTKIDGDSDLKSSLTKRYTGVAVFDENAVNKLKSDLKDVEVSNPSNAKFSNTALMSLTSHLLTGSGTTEDPYKTDGSVSDASLTAQINAGKYRLTVTSTEFAGRETFKESYWGHRANYDYAEITQADTQTSIAITHADGTEITSEEQVEKTDELTYMVTVTPHHGNEASEGVAAHDAEAKTCASPTGTVQLYLKFADGTTASLGVLTLSAASETDTSGYHYSTASLTTDLSSYTLAQLKDAKVLAKYSGEQNYKVSESSEEDLPVIDAYVLPSTGGTGTTVIYGLGNMSLISAAVLFVYRQKKKAARI